MTTDEAIALAESRGWTISHLGKRSDGSWASRLYNPGRASEVLGKPGFNDSITDYGDGPTAADAILRALSLRYDRETGKVVEFVPPPFSRLAEANLEHALSEATRTRYLRPQDFISLNTWAPLHAALDKATRARAKR